MAGTPKEASLYNWGISPYYFEISGHSTNNLGKYPSNLAVLVENNEITLIFREEFPGSVHL